MVVYLGLYSLKAQVIIGFADDITMIIRAVGLVKRWIAGIELKHADHKTYVLLISSRKIMEFVTVMLCDQCTTSKQAIQGKYQKVGRKRNT